MDHREPDLESVERLLRDMPLSKPSARLDQRVAAALGKPGGWTTDETEANVETDNSARPSPPKRRLGAPSWAGRPRRIVVAAIVGGAVAAALVLLAVGPWGANQAELRRPPDGLGVPTASNQDREPSAPHEHQTVANEPSPGDTTPGPNDSEPGRPSGEAPTVAGSESPEPADPRDVAGPDWPERLGPPPLVFDAESVEAEPIQIEQVWSSLAANDVVRTEPARPMQRVQRQVHRRVQWIDPQRHVYIEWNIPSEQSALVPLEFN